jgi:hypothetical protein
MSEETKVEETNEKVAAAMQERYLDSFVKYATAHGIAPRSEEELEHMLKIASKIRDIQDKQEPAVKEASASIVKEACDALYALDI